MRRTDSFFFFFPFLHWQRTSEIEGREGYKGEEEKSSLILIRLWWFLTDDRRDSTERERAVNLCRRNQATSSFPIPWSFVAIVCVCYVHVSMCVCLPHVPSYCQLGRIRRRTLASNSSSKRGGGPVRLKCIYHSICREPMLSGANTQHTHTLYIALCLSLLVSSLSIVALDVYVRVRRYGTNSWGSKGIHSYRGGELVATPLLYKGEELNIRSKMWNIEREPTEEE